MTESEQNLQGTFEGSVRNAKARFAGVDEERLLGYLQSRPDVHGEVRLTDVSYPSEAGASNGIAFFTAELDRGQGRCEQRFVLRYAPGVSLFLQKNFADEFKTLCAAAEAGMPVPEVMWLDAEGEQLGFPCYTMLRVDGDAPAGAMYSSGPLADVSSDQRKAMMLEAAGFHGRLRRAAIGADRVPHLLKRGVGSNAIERELNWWLEEDRHVLATDDERLQLIESVYQWLLTHQPDTYEPVLVHGDAQIANIMFRDGRIAAVLDWELSYLGHGEADVALISFLTETMKMMDKPVDGTPTEAEYIARFEQESGLPVQHWPYFKLFSMYKVCAVTLLTMGFMPQFDSVWQFYNGYLQQAWDQARAEYS